MSTEREKFRKKPVEPDLKRRWSTQEEKKDPSERHPSELFRRHKTSKRFLEK